MGRMCAQIPDMVANTADSLFGLFHFYVTRLAMRLLENNVDQSGTCPPQILEINVEPRKSFWSILRLQQISGHMRSVTPVDSNPP